jgi:pyruvate/oxaloacetate carboxyltransferase
MAASHTTDIIVSEVLFVVRNYFGRTPRTTNSSVLSGFYTDEEISEAKTVVLSFAEVIDPKMDDLKNIRPRTGGTKRKREAEDILQIYSLLDAQKVSLPMYVAFNVLRIPSFRPEDVDVCAMATSINNLSTQEKDI